MGFDEILESEEFESYVEEAAGQSNELTKDYTEGERMAFVQGMIVMWQFIMGVYTNFLDVDEETKNDIKELENSIIEMAKNF